MRHFQSEVRAVVTFVLQFLLAIIFPYTRFSVKHQKNRDTLCLTFWGRIFQTVLFLLNSLPEHAGRKRHVLVIRPGVCLASNLCTVQE